MKLSKIFLNVSAVYALFFLVFVVVKYGWLASISESAKYLTKDGLSFLFFVFIGILSGAVMWSAKSIIATFAGCSFLLIGTITGYDSMMGNEQLQHIIHIAAVFTAIPLINIDYWRQFKKLGHGNSGIIFITIFIIPSYCMYACKLKNVVYWIEIWSFIVTIFVYNIILKERSWKN